MDSKIEFWIVLAIIISPILLFVWYMTRREKIGTNKWLEKFTNEHPIIFLITLSLVMFIIAVAIISFLGGILLAMFPYAGSFEINNTTYNVTLLPKGEMEELNILEGNESKYRYVGYLREVNIETDGVTYGERGSNNIAYFKIEYKDGNFTSRATKVIFVQAATRKDDDFFDPADPASPMNPANPLNPMHPASPFNPWND
jgi:hypothetical protein